MKEAMKEIQRNLNELLHMNLSGTLNKTKYNLRVNEINMYTDQAITFNSKRRLFLYSSYCKN